MNMYICIRKEILYVMHVIPCLRVPIIHPDCSDVSFLLQVPLLAKQIAQIMMIVNFVVENLQNPKMDVNLLILMMTYVLKHFPRSVVL